MRFECYHLRQFSPPSGLLTTRFFLSGTERRSTVELSMAALVLTPEIKSQPRVALRRYAIDQAIERSLYLVEQTSLHLSRSCLSLQSADEALERAYDRIHSSLRLLNLSLSHVVAGVL